MYSIYWLKLKWLKVKRQIHQKQTFWGSQIFNYFIVEVLALVIQPYWFLQGLTFKDSKFNEHTVNIRYQYNDILLATSIFVKMYPLYVFIIQMS